MKAKDLIKILLSDPGADVQIGWEEFVQYSELTGGEEDRFSEIEVVYKGDSGFTLSGDHYMYMGEKVYEQR